MTLLSKPAILREMEAGNILIDPFNPDHLRPNSYDLTLGEWIWREQPTAGLVGPVGSGLNAIYNYYSKKHVKRLWTKERALYAKDLLMKEDFRNGRIEGIGPKDKVFFIHPGESILAHTNEFVGGRGNTITSQLFARSSAGRNFLEVCRCAGMGDVGYYNRWTLEIQNNSKYHSLPLIVGRRYAQVAFQQVEAVEDADVYNVSGKYHTEGDVEKMKAAWKPEDMLPRAWNDAEAVACKTVST